MNVHISYRTHKTPDIEKDVQHHIDKLTKRLQVFRPELIHLKGVVEQNSPREGFVVSLNLRLPSGQMAVQNSAPAASPAIKAAFEDLLQQINKHKALLRSSHKWSRRRSANERSEAQVPFESTIAAVQAPVVSPDDIRSYINANLGRLERFVDREIAYREASALIPVDLITRDEVIDEAVARAMGNGEEKPERVALEPWLYRMAIHAISDLAAREQDEVPAIHLEESVRKQNVRASDEAELQFHQPDETLTEESVIADRGVATPEDIAYTDEMATLVQFALRGVSDAVRAAFILHSIEGFTVDEIAVITDQRPGEVQTSITKAREHLRRFAPIENLIKEKVLQESGQ